MASKVDMSLDDLVSFSRKKGQGGGQGKFNRFNQTGGQKTWRVKQSSNQQTGGGGGEGGTKVGDLRDVLAEKQKSSVGDLRSKLKPKALYTSKFSKSQPSTPQGSQTSPSGSRRSTQSARGKHISPMKPIHVDEPSSPVRPSRRSDPGPISHKQRAGGQAKLPSYDEAKKITVTVPGMRHPPTSTEYSHQRREERLAAAIARSKEQRHDSYMRGREEALASAISSAFIGGESRPSHSREKERSQHHAASFHSRTQLRAFSPSPSPPPDMSYESHFSLPSVPHPPAPVPISRGPFSSAIIPHAGKGITTLTSMIISNLSDTVSKNDVAELCSAVGPLEGVYMPAAGMAEVVFKYKDDALEAFKKYNQRNLDGQPMVCRVHPTSRNRLSGYGHSYTDDLYAPAPHSGFY